MNTPSNPKKLDILLSGLANEKRRGILQTLAYRPATITQLAEEHGLSLPAIHKHLRALERAGLIKRRKVGRVNFVAINRQGIKLAQDWIMQFRAEWGNDQESLENYIAHFHEK